MRTYWIPRPPCVVCQAPLQDKCRVVVVNNDMGSTQPTYELSGIVHGLHSSSPCPWRVPLERYKEVDSECKPPKIYCNIYPAHLGNVGDLPDGSYGFPLHTYCWKIVQRLLGPLVNNQLQLFIQMLEKRWDGRRIHNINRFMTVNPMRTPALGKLIKHSKLRWKRSRMINLNKKAANENTDKSLSFIECSALSLPLEVKFMILDHVDPKDMENMLLATQWKIPETYWRMRLYSGNMFEIYGLDQEKNIDWRWLCVQFEIRSQTWPALCNRNRIVDIIKDIVGPFHDALGTNSREELQQLNQDRKGRLIEAALQSKKRRQRRHQLYREAWP